MSGKIRWTGGPAPLWSCTPPPPRVKKYERFKVDPGPGQQLVIVSGHLEETRTHFVDQRTVPCTGDDGTCWVDHRAVGNPRYCGWLAVKLPRVSRVYLLSLTPVAVAIEPRVRDASRDLAGLTLKVWRVGNHDRSEMHAALQLDVPRVAELPPTPDIRFCLERMWAAEDRPVSKARPVAGRMQRAFAAQAKGGE